ncbi:ABC transporter ATP-binding protein [Devosia sp.]|uniref:ABC transporter ATP-binding protein n=1 Tax=Devosia sp. TaxID=1871048 RepID=UPI002AFE01D2|nr:ATP-binding cassette domain-containing protein [Devosia sp.]
MLDLLGLEHRFSGQSAGAQPALDIASLTITPGRLTVIRGPSGSGKTTLLYVLSGLIKPSAGQVRWSGLDIAALGETERDRWRRRNAGFVFQSFNLMEELNPLGNVTLAAYFSAWTDRTVRKRAIALLERFGIANEPRRVDTYSQGEQQRVALARALVFDPPILFADEPTASLDAGNSIQLCDDFKRLASEGRAIVAVSHDPLLIAAADSVVALDHGRIGDGKTLS